MSKLIPFLGFSDPIYETISWNFWVWKSSNSKKRSIGTLRKNIELVLNEKYEFWNSGFSKTMNFYGRCGTFRTPTQKGLEPIFVIRNLHPDIENFQLRPWFKSQSCLQGDQSFWLKVFVKTNATCSLSQSMRVPMQQKICNSLPIASLKVYSCRLRLLSKKSRML